jgi:hypothetical protein
MDCLFEMIESEWNRFGWHMVWIAVLDRECEPFKAPIWHLEHDWKFVNSVKCLSFQIGILTVLKAFYPPMQLIDRSGWTKPSSPM